MAPVLIPTAGGRHSLPPTADLPPPTAQLKYGQPSIHDYVSLGTHPPSRSLDIESKPGSPPKGTPGCPSSTNSSLFPFLISLFTHPQALREAGPHSHRGSTRPVPVCSTPGTGLRSLLGQLPLVLLRPPPLCTHCLTHLTTCGIQDLLPILRPRRLKPREVRATIVRDGWQLRHCQAQGLQTPCSLCYPPLWTPQKGSQAPSSSFLPAPDTPNMCGVHTRKMVPDSPEYHCPFRHQLPSSACHRCLHSPSRGVGGAGVK